MRAPGTVRRRALEWLAVAMLVIVAAILWASIAQAADVAPFAIPEWLYATVVAGAVQGLVTYGAIKVKFDWLFHRMKALEVKQASDHQATGERIDAMLVHRHRRSTDNCIDEEKRDS